MLGLKLNHVSKRGHRLGVKLIHVSKTGPRMTSLWLVIVNRLLMLATIHNYPKYYTYNNFLQKTYSVNHRAAYIQISLRNVERHTPLIWLKSSHNDVHADFYFPIIILTQWTYCLVNHCSWGAIGFAFSLEKIDFRLLARDSEEIIVVLKCDGDKRLVMKHYGRCTCEIVLRVNLVLFSSNWSRQISWWSTSYVTNSSWHGMCKCKHQCIVCLTLFWYPVNIEICIM